MIGRRILTFAAALLLSIPLLAETWNLNTNQYNKYGKTDGQYNMEYWTSVEGGTNGLTSSALVAGDDYVSENGRWISFEGNYVFVGKSLTIGKSSAGRTGILQLRGQKITFPNDGVFLDNGYMKFDNYRSNDKVINAYSNLIGKATVTASKNNPFNYRSGYHNLQLYMDGELIGDANAGLSVGEANNRSNCLFTVNHADQFYGDITVFSGRTNDTVRNFGYGLGLGNSSYPGRIAFTTAGTLLWTPRPGATGVVNRLELADGTHIRFTYDPATGQAGFIDVTGTLALPNADIVVQADYAPVASTTGEDVVCPLLRGPAGMRLNVSQFIFEPNAFYEPSNAANRYPQRIHFEVQTDPATDRDTLNVVVEPIVTLNGNDGDSRNFSDALARGSSLTNSNWSDSRVPHANAHYWVRSYLNVPPSHEDWTFVGKSLIYSGGTFYVFGDHSLAFSCIELGSMRFRGGNNANTTFCGGKIRMYSGQRIIFSSYNTQTLRVESEIEGNSPILLQGESSTDYPRGYFAFAGLNTNWFGRLGFHDKIGASSHNYEPTYNKAYLTLWVTDGRNLGGRMDNFTFDALTLSAYCQIAATNDVTLAEESNRGLFVTGHGGRFYVETGATLSCGWPITMDATLYKERAGTLALGGGIKFIEVSDGVTNLVDTLPAEAEKRTLVVTNGYVKALSADCVNGLTLDMAANATTGLKLDYMTPDVTLAQYGFRNVKTDAPFAGGSIDVTVENVTPATFSMLKRKKLGLVTVKTTVADVVQDRLRVSRQPDVISKIVREDDAETGWTTFSLSVRLGFVVNIR